MVKHNMGGSWYIKEISIDSRERTRGYNAYITYEETYKVNVDTLSYGDYIFYTQDDKEVVFEYKNTKDFIKSMEDKSLFQELSNQCMHYEYSYLIVCGDFDETYDYLYWNVPHYRYKYKTTQLLKNRLNSQVKGAFARIYSMYIPIIFVDTEEQAFAEMLKVATKVADAKKYGGVTRPVPQRYLEMNPCQWFLSGFDGIGNIKSERIVDELGIECVDDLCKLKPSEFLSVKRVTEKNVKEIWKKLHNEELNMKDTSLQN